ncbi:MAG TPA: hypothetical protein PKX48_02130 [Planctomycetota bacterium]|jgi:hypothetical protein|nr:hypothetical protein [Planctomycetota bacterium]OQC21564.1 MAG: hypothetical protein BWX69_00773 [Planctomycetes bacterium ADurb.Bin069]HNR98570.1 hypothetical protein [Planctomycetota bacterium]HNU26115.1 hypothetical protein [Planctomycetota bacterium]HOE28794.1 hypothetical protein [Planctomycetota bacterium]
MQGREGRIRDPEEELAAAYRARVRPFLDLADAAGARRYEEAWELARARLRDVRRRSEGHAS